MDHPFSSFPAYILAFLLIIFTLLTSLHRTKTERKLSPGPWMLPITGNMHQLANALPRALFAQRPISCPAAVFTYNFKYVALGHYGHYWRQLQKMCVVELLSSTRVQSFRSIREEEVSSLVRSITAASSEGLPVNIGGMLLRLTSDIISRTAFGGSNVEKHASICKKISEVLGGFTNRASGFLHGLDGVKHKVIKLQKEMDAVFQTVIDEHRAKTDQAEELGARGEADSILDVLFDIQDRGELELSTENIKAILFDGIETSATTMEWTMTELLRNTRAMKKSQAEVRQVFHGKGEICETMALYELKYLKAVVKEVLRLHPPGSLLLPREARQDVEINGYDMPVKAKLIVNVWAIGRDPNYSSEPDRFYPERFLDGTTDYKGKHFELGAGRKLCPGMLLAISIIELPLANLLYHFDWTLPYGWTAENLDMSEAPGVVVAAGEKIPLQLIATPYPAMSTKFNNTTGY